MTRWCFQISTVRIVELTIACQNQKMELSDDWLPDLINGKMVRVPVCRERVSGEKVPVIGQFTGKLSTFPAFLRELGA